MKTDTHPKYEIITVTCACGTTYEVGSVGMRSNKVDICSACHPLFTGTQKLLDIAGRVDRFKKRYAKTPTSPQKHAKAPRSAKRSRNVLEELKSLRKPNS